jgi:hypothetical protein
VKTLADKILLPHARQEAVAQRNALPVLWHDVPILGNLSVVRHAKTSVCQTPRKPRYNGWL